MNNSKKTTTKKGARRSPADTNEDIAEKYGDIGLAAFNFYYTYSHLPPLLRDAVIGAIAGVADELGLPSPTATRGEVAGFKRLVELCKAAGAHVDA